MTKHQAPVRRRVEKASSGAKRSKACKGIQKTSFTEAQWKAVIMQYFDSVEKKMWKTVSDFLRHKASDLFSMKQQASFSKRLAMHKRGELGTVG